jgi:hypothetical protein
VRSLKGHKQKKKLVAFLFGLELVGAHQPATAAWPHSFDFVRRIHK